MNVENLHNFFQNAQNIGLVLVAIFACIVWITGKSVERSQNEQKMINEEIAEKLSILAVDLDNSISQFSFVFEFSKDVNILDMIAEPSYIEIMSPPKNGESKHTLISIGVNSANLMINDDTPRVPFEVKSSPNNGALRLQNVKSNVQKRFEIVLLPQFLDNPFTSIRDFSDCRVSPLLSDLMINNLSKITMAVNGWPILECDIKSAYWRKEDSNVLGVSIKQNKPWSTDFHQSTIPYSLWRINLSRDLPQIAKNAYYHSIEMKEKNK